MVWVDNSFPPQKTWSTIHLSPTTAVDSLPPPPSSDLICTRIDGTCNFLFLSCTSPSLVCFLQIQVPYQKHNTNAFPTKQSLNHPPKIFPFCESQICRTCLFLLNFSRSWMWGKTSFLGTMWTLLLEVRSRGIWFRILLGCCSNFIDNSGIDRLIIR